MLLKNLISFTFGILAATLFFGLLATCATSARAEFEFPPPPDPPPAMPSSEATTNDAGEVRIDPPPGVTASFTAEPIWAWELSFETSEDLAFTNTTAYPITVTVPFETTNGFVRVNAKKINLREK